MTNASLAQPPTPSRSEPPDTFMSPFFVTPGCDIPSKPGQQLRLSAHEDPISPRSEQQNAVELGTSITVNDSKSSDASVLPSAMFKRQDSTLPRSEQLVTGLGKSTAVNVLGSFESSVLSLQFLGRDSIPSSSTPSATSTSPLSGARYQKTQHAPQTRISPRHHTSPVRNLQGYCP